MLPNPSDGRRYKDTTLNHINDLYTFKPKTLVRPVLNSRKDSRQRSKDLLGVSKDKDHGYFADK